MSWIDIPNSDLYRLRYDTDEFVAFYSLDGNIDKEDYVKVSEETNYNFIKFLDNGDHIGSIYVDKFCPKESYIKVRQLYFNATTVDEFHLIYENVQWGITEFKVGDFYSYETLPNEFKNFPIRYTIDIYHSNIYALTQEDALQMRLMS